MSPIKFDNVIIDGDPFLYSCGFSIEEWNEDKTEKVFKPNHSFETACWNLDNMLMRCINLWKGEGQSDYFIYLTPPLNTNFRIEVDTTYKANRKNARRPLVYKELKQYMIDKWNAEITNGQEADDACSILQHSFNESSFYSTSHASIVCSIDKDFDNIPGHHYNIIRDVCYFLSPLDSLRHFYLQILTGDASDGISRIKKGWRQKESEKKINEALTEVELYTIVFKEMQKILDATDLEAEEELIKRGRLLWLRTKENEFWNPPLK